MSRADSSRAGLFPRQDLSRPAAGETRMPSAAQLTRGRDPGRLTGTTTLLTWLALACCAAGARGATFNVPAGTPIQPVINAAQDGDVIILGAGVHNQHIDFAGKDITIRSSNPESDGTVANTILNGGGAGGPVVTFENGESSQALLYGLTIRNGSGKPDAGFLAGAGVFIRNASPTVWRCVITANTTQVGAGVYVTGGAPLIERNFIHHNIATHSGGGVKIVNNSAAEIRTNLITGNRSNTVGGGGIDLFGCLAIAPVIRHNVIVGNYASAKGAAVSCSAASPDVINNIFAFNRAGGTGAGLFSDGGGAPYWCHNDSWMNTPANYGAGLVLCATGTIVANPIFVSPGAWSDPNGTPGNLADDLWVDGNYRLSAGSPCIDSGDWTPPLSPWEPPWLDYLGDTRLRDDRCMPNVGPTISVPVDMGAYEYLDTVPPVVKTYVGPNGGSWLTPGNWNPFGTPNCSSEARINGTTSSMLIPAGNALADRALVGHGTGAGTVMDIQAGASLTANIVRTPNGAQSGRIRQLGGTVHVADTLDVGSAIVSIGDGFYELHNGDLVATSIRVGFDNCEDFGTMTQTGGTCLVTDTLRVGGDNTCTPNAGGRYDLRAGTLETQNAVIGGSNSEFTFFGNGTMMVDGPSSFWANHGFAAVGGGESRGSLDIVNGAKATLADVLAPDGEGTASITLQGLSSRLECQQLNLGVGWPFVTSSLQVLAGASVQCSGLLNSRSCQDQGGSVVSAVVRVSGAGSLIDCTGAAESGGNRDVANIIPSARPPLIEVNAGGTLRAASLSNFPFGEIRGNGGLLDTNVTNTGLISPGVPMFNPFAFGTLTITGDLSQVGTYQPDCALPNVQTRSGRTVIEIGGSTAGVNFDVLHINGRLIGGGSLSVNLVNGFDPPLNSQFIIGTYGELVQPFALVNTTPMSGDRFLRVTYEPTALAGGGGAIVVTVVSLTELIGFVPPNALALGRLPTDLAIADFDGEDGPDVAVSVPATSPNSVPGDVFVLLNNGTTGQGWMGFTMAAQIPVGRNPRSIATGDFNNLNGPDLVVANRDDDDISVLSNNGMLEGAASFTRTDIPIGDQPISVGSGDLNGDGRDDVLVGNQGAFNASTGAIGPPGTITYLAATMGGFATPVVRPAGVRPSVIDPADVDNDRDLDIVAFSTLPQNVAPNSYVEHGQMTTLDNRDGAGDLGNAIFYTINGSGIGMDVADLDNDNLVDVIIGNTTSNGITYFRNAGGGLYQGGVLAPLNGEPLSVVAVDFDADNDRDLAAAVDANGTPQVNVLTNLLDGGGPNALQFGPPIVPPDTQGAILVEEADVDGDQSPDLVVITDENALSPLAGGGIAGGPPEGAPAMAKTLVNLLEACIGDTNGSGTVDVDDLITVILRWGPCPTPPSPCPGDTNNSSTVDVDDLITVILHWGACP
jgi:T5SS/PEP-CTERM-associated repeat protein